jgi:hypothetical protein
MFRILSLQQRPKIIGDRKHPTFAILRAPGVQPDFPGLQIDVAPLQRQNFAVDPPARDVRELHDWAQGGRQMREQARELVEFKEPSARIVLAQ